MHARRPRSVQKAAAFCTVHLPPVHRKRDHSASPPHGGSHTRISPPQQGVGPPVAQRRSHGAWRDGPKRPSLSASAHRHTPRQAMRFGVSARGWHLVIP
ncbi:hypothetical protein roselon_01855 [Roseibacterium elongatum DSM 19469]|uniref:Uncharacterized protein n=1 Tax=Roseicyclus elongatus DSM 19469 TaxID=1294273 RepID=W8RSV3_9RHOB|nr:hypothetical protein roselon_01855 [Roseibacterium elongatum DSM 19469]